MTAAPRWLSRATAVALLLSAPGAFAQSTTQAQKKPETVIVTAQEPNDTIDAIVSQFVDAHAAKNRKTGQYMRDDVRPICPVTLGLPPAFNAFVTARVLAVATSVGAQTGTTGSCKPNIEILFTDQPQELVKSLADRTRGAILGMHFLHERPGLLNITHPIQAWYVTGTRYDENSFEPVMNIRPDGSTEPGGSKKPAIDSAYRNAPEATALGSKIPMRRVSTFLNVLIVADTNMVGGQEIGPISDYIAMLALSEPRALDDCNALPSILDLMSSGCEARAKPKTLTANDIAYLRALYAADLGSTTVSVERDNIATGMKANLGER